MAGFAPRVQPAGVTKLIHDGQSFLFVPTDATAYPQIMKPLLPAGLYRHDVVGISSTTYAQRATSATTRVDQRIPIVERSVLIDCGGMSDIINTAGNLTAAQLLTAIESYVDNRRTAGVDYVIACTIPIGTGAWYDADALTQRTTYNTNLKASSHFDAIADIAAIPQAADANDTTYFSDGLHPTLALATLYAVEIISAMRRIGLKVS